MPRYNSVIQAEVRWTTKSARDIMSVVPEKQNSEIVLKVEGGSRQAMKVLGKPY